MTLRHCWVLALGASLACRGDDKPAADTPIVTAAPAAPASSDSAAPACPMFGTWRFCSIEKRLESAGLVIKKHADSVHHAFLGVPGIAYDVSTAELQVFVYPTARDRERDTAKLDTLIAAPPGTVVQWKLPPTVIVSNNLLAILLSKNETQIERLQLAITAGLPAK
jgi:hypothetical protein